MQSLYLLFLVAVIVFITFPFTFKMDFFYNLNLNRGTFSIKVWFITLKKADLKRRGKDIILIEKRKNEDFEIEIGEEQLRFLKTFFNEVKNKFKIRKIYVDSVTGADSPFYSAIFSSVYSAFILGLFSRLKTKQPTAAFGLNNNTDFFEFVFKIKINTRISISIFDVLYSLLISLLKSKKDRLLEKKLKKI